MDVHVPRAITTALRKRGVDVITAQEDGSAEIPDHELLDRAALLGRVLVSQDADLLREGMRRLRQDTQFSGIIYTHQRRLTIGEVVKELELIAVTNSLGDWQSRIEYLPVK